MERKDFLKKSAIGIGTLSIIPIFNACKSESTRKSDVKSLKTVGAILQNPKLVTKRESVKLNVLGDNQSIKLTGEDTNGQYALIEQNNEPGIGIPPHVHENEDEVFQVLSGQVSMSIGNKTSILQAGDLVFCPKGVPHSWKVVGKENARAMLSIFPAGLEVMFIELAELAAGPTDMEKVSEICGKYNLRFV
ncbi:cupin domain [Oceanihabitans sediminis]|uniref:Cupin domain-containing protein n=1 Tax=Oceanihabitans sediminis TaxID=1812012 RepID=A0A368P4I7_9FLAO|nr:cupin domain-containing protein [Oceanihabitans sediminis]RBP28492.1 cupin domain [Oceanihabitans sediminis]RCU56689.1 cupin domain-containing protein [Oceanihabitans sediminis]